MNWQRSGTREPSKTKAELRQMLTEAVRNTPSPDQQSKRPAKAEEIPAEAACID
jgi:hypothetical protein